MWDYALGGLAAAGNILDLPSSSIRDIAAALTTGDWKKYNPLDQWGSAWWRDRGNRLTGRELNRLWGWAGKENNWKNFLGGLATEIASDLLIPVTGPLGSYARGVKSTQPVGKELAKTAGEAIEEAIGRHWAPGTRAVETLTRTPLPWTEQLRLGERELMGLRIPFTRYGIGFSGGDWFRNRVADAVEKLFYGKAGLAPWTWPRPAVRAVRSLFSPTVGRKSIGAMSPARHMMEDIFDQQMQHMMAGVYNAAEPLHQSYEGLRQSILDMAKEAMGDSAKVVKQPETAGRLIRMLQEIGDILPKPGEVVDAARRADIESALLGNLENFMVRQNPALTREARFALRDKHSDSLKRALYDYVVNSQKASRYTWEIGDELGLPRRIGGDSFISHAPRHTIDPKGGINLERARKDILENHPFGSSGFDEIAMDPLIGGFKTTYKGRMHEWRNEVREWLTEHGVSTKANGRQLSDAQLAQELILHKYMRPAFFEHQRMFPHHVDMAGDIVKKGEQIKFEDFERYWRSPSAADVAKARIAGKTKKPASRLSRLQKYMARLDPDRARLGVFEPNANLNFMQNLDWNIRQIATVQSVREMLKKMYKAGELTGDIPLEKVWMTGTKKYRGWTKRGLDTLRKEMGVGPDTPLFVSKEVADAIAGFRKAIEPEFISELKRVWDKMSALYRGWLTTGLGPVAMSFFTRNMSSGIFQEITHGKASVKEILKAKLDATKWLASGGGLEHAEEAIRIGVLGDLGMLSEVAGEQAAKQMMEEGIHPGSLRAMFIDPLKRAARGEGWNPFHVRGTTYHPSQMTKGMTEPKSWMAEWGENAYKAGEAINRLGYYEALRRTGYKPAQAKQFVKEAHFAYNELSQFEKRFMRRGTLFYGWLRKSIPFTILKVMERPGGLTSQAIRAATMPLREEGDYIPSFLRERAAIPLGGPERATRYLTSLGPLDPLQDLNLLAIRRGFVPTLRRTLEKSFSTLNPLATALIYELPSGRQAWSGRELKYLRSRLETAGKQMFGEQFNLPPIIKRLEGVGPQSRLISEIGKFTDPDKTWGEALINWLSGSRVSTYDPKMYQYIDAIEGLRQQLGQEATVREFTKQYVPQRLRPYAPTEVMNRLRRLQELHQFLQGLPPARPGA